jgi:hypothetical protein
LLPSRKRRLICLCYGKYLLWKNLILGRLGHWYRRRSVDDCCLRSRT